MVPKSAEDKLTLHLLGPPQITWQGELLKIVRRQARAILYCVAAAPNPLSRERLAFLFWSDVPDATARRNLSRLLSYLRKALPRRDCLLVNRRAVRLNPEWAWSDCRAVEALSEKGELAALAKIPDHFRGRFLEGFSLPDAPEYEKWSVRRADEWEQHYLAVLRRLVTVHSDRDEHQKAIEYARRYLAADDLAEDVHRQLITLCGMVGDRAAATRHFERCSLILERELGVPPLPETRAAYEAALHETATQPAPRPLPPSWSVLPSLELPLVGREAALQSLEAAATRLASGGLILIAGEPGVGKSRLLQTFAVASGRTVLSGNSHLVTHTIPYQLLVDALRQALDAPPLWRHIRPIWLTEAARLLPDLSEIFPDLPPPLEVQPEQAQARLFEALSHCVFGLGTDNPLLLCLDDLHWADAATLHWLVGLAGRFPDPRLLLVATVRSGQITAVADVQRAFRRADRLVEVNLAGLTRDAIGQALRELELPLSESECPALAGRLHRETGGNAFFLLETIRTLLENERLHAPPDTLPLAATVEDAVRSRVETLTGVSQQLLQAAAVLSPDLDPGLLQRTAGRTDLEVADALDELVARQLLRENDSGHAFSHELVRTAVYQAMTPWRRKILHHRAAGAIDKVTTGEELPRLAARARHYDAAGANREAIQAYRQAAEAYQTVHAHDDAISLLRRAIDLLKETKAKPETFARLHEALGQNLAHAARHRAARDAFRRALDHSPDNPMLLARLNWRIAHSHLSQLHYDRARLRLEQALAALDRIATEKEDAFWRLWLDVKMSEFTLRFYLVDPGSCEALVHELAPVVLRAGTPQQRLRFARDKIYAALLQDRFHPSAETISLLLREHQPLADQSGGVHSRALASFVKGWIFFLADNLAAAEDPFLTALADAEKVGYRFHEARCLAFLSSLFREKGDHRRAEQFARRGLQAGRSVGSRHYQAHCLATLAWIDYCQGKTTTALSQAKEAAAYFADPEVPFAWLAHVILLAIYNRKGQLEKAIQSAEVMLDPRQRRLQDKLAGVLREAINGWHAGELDDATLSLNEAVAVADEIGYL